MMKTTCVHSSVKSKRYDESAQTILHIIFVVILCGLYKIQNKWLCKGDYTVR
jgi:hypothetical protein